MSVPLGFDFESSTAQASPFYNNAGITFGNAGGIEAGGTSAQAVKQQNPTRQTAGGLNAFPDGSVSSDLGLPPGSPNLLWYILGGIAAIGLALFAYKKLS